MVVLEQQLPINQQSNKKSQSDEMTAISLRAYAKKLRLDLINTQKDYTLSDYEQNRELFRNITF